MSSSASPSIELRQEKLNAITHGVGIFLSLVGLFVLVSYAARYGGQLRVIGCAIFAGTMVAVYVASTLSHSFTDPKRLHFFRTLDQGMIYLSIVGTATPLAFEYLNSTGLWIYFGVMWLIAIAGCMSKLFFSHRVNSVAVWIYLLLGWMPFFVLPWLIGVVPSGAMWLMLLGGMIYSIGTIFLIVDNQRYYFHVIWHLMVIAGSICHFFTILNYVACRNDLVV